MSIGAIAQTTVMGKVYDADSNEPLIGASVLLVGTTTGTVTDIDGNFSLDAPNPKGIIEITYTGFATQRLSFDGPATFDDIRMTIDAMGLS